MSVNPANPPRPALRAADKETFAHITATHRWKDIIKKAIDNIRDSLNCSEVDKNEEGKKIIASMEELINQIQRKDQLIQIEDDGRPDIVSWNDALNTYFKGENWFTTTWLFAECYLYRRIISIITNTKHWKNYDPYFRQKEDSFKVSFTTIFEFSKRIDELISLQKVKTNDKLIFYELAKLSLWGNAIDLSIDLIFSDWLIQSGYVSKVYLHVKPIPWFVSDTTLEDFNWLLKTLKNNEFFSSISNIEKLSLEKLFNRWQSYITNSNWIITSDFFWTSPYSFWHLEEKAPELYNDLCKSHLIIFKGDLNYRKLVYDCKWESITPFKDAIGPLGNSKNSPPLLSLRTGKSDVFVGLDEGVEKSLGSDKSWMYSGKFAVIQFSEGYHMVYLSFEKRARIFTLLNERYPTRYVADHEKVSQSTVVRIKQCKKETGIFSNKPKPGCLRLLTGHYEQKVLWYIITGECTNAVSVQKKLKTDEGIIVSKNTIKWTLRRNGLRA
ncbi:12615_t:CDS:2 [Cetraspora pellucida]|uniref:Sugar phosphate phosphatase n=1 Tax=Cetraspora pellucida TaxID=1433469 RepID=A0A9N9FN24_9GLOM|nr:12615_t:CDS:2 [Cetraspora pellucida]